MRSCANLLAAASGIRPPTEDVILDSLYVHLFETSVPKFVPMDKVIATEDEEILENADREEKEGDCDLFIDRLKNWMIQEPSIDSKFLRSFRHTANLRFKVKSGRFRTTYR